MWLTRAAGGTITQKSKRTKDYSASLAYASQSAFLRLVNVRWEGSRRIIRKKLPCWTMIEGPTFEDNDSLLDKLRVVKVRHSGSIAMWE